MVSPSDLTPVDIPPPCDSRPPSSICLSGFSCTLGTSAKVTMANNGMLTAVRQSFKLITCSNCFFKCLEQIEIVSVGDGNLKAELKLQQQHCNLYGTMAGGMACTINDILTSYAVMTEAKDNDKRIIGGVSIKLDVSYMSPARLGQVIVIHCSTLKAGKSVQFINMDIFDKTSGRLVCRGQHIHKSMMTGKIQHSVM